MSDSPITGLHPIDGMGVPHKGCACRSCEIARIQRSKASISLIAPPLMVKEEIIINNKGKVSEVRRYD